jgi:phospholipid transport system transporter-binding protein
VSASVQRDGQCLRLAGELDFASAGALREQLTALIAGCAGQALTLDLSAVSRSNSVGLSLLLCAARSADEHKVDLRAAGLPSGMLSMARVCGLDNWLQQLSVEPLDLKETPHATP